MSRPHFSKLFKVSDANFASIVNTSASYSEVLRKCHMEPKGGNINTVKRRIKLLGIDDSHIPKGNISNKNRIFNNIRIPLKTIMTDVLIENSTTPRHTVKKYVMRHDLIPYKCKCGIEREWRGIPISLQLEHKNGAPNDNRVENLTFMCPNCHSQTNTFAGKKNKKF